MLLNEIVLTESEVWDCLLALDPNKASGPDNIPARILKLTANQIAPSVCRLFNLSLQLGVMPTAWKEANITPVEKMELMPVWKTTDQYRYYAFSRKFWKDVFIITSLTLYHIESTKCNMASNHRKIVLLN